MVDQFQAGKIREALKQLDPQNAEHWTDDNLPQVSAVQQLTSDPSIRRHDIQAAWPGFDKSALASDGGSKDAPAVVEAITNKDGGSTVVADEHGNEYEEYNSAEELLASYEADVKHWENELVKAHAMIRQGQANVVLAAKKAEEAKAVLRKAFPPITEAENIKAHIQSEQAMRRARVEGRGAPSQLDLSMRRSNSRGWRRPKRTLMGAPAPTA